MKPLVPIILFLTLFGCIPNEIVKGETIDNPDKRNENWCWFIDKETGQGKWVPVSDETNLPDGDFTLFYCDGIIREVGTLENNIRVDTLYFYGRNDSLVYKTIFLEDSVYRIWSEGKYKIHFSSCELKEEGEYKYDKRVGVQLKYNKEGITVFRKVLSKDSTMIESFYDNGVPKVRKIELNGGEKGSVFGWYKNGVPSNIGYYRNGEFEGVIKRFYENGNLLYEIEMQEGKHNGKRVDYFENGNIFALHYFMKGVEHGLYKEYYEDNQLLTEGNMLGGKRDGLWTTYFENGKIKGIENYEMDQLMGVSTSYYNSGQIEYTSELENGEVIFYKKYDKKGELIEEFQDGKVIYP